MSKVKYDNFVADFETTVYEGQQNTEVWAAAIISLASETDPDNVFVVNSIDKFMDFVFNEAGNKRIYFHNLKFDGSFIIPWLFNNGFKLWTTADGEKLIDARRLYVMPSKHFTCMIGDMGQWYTITIHFRHKFICFVDSLKLLPFSVAAIGKGFKTKYQKLEIEYEGMRQAGGVISEQETDYIKNDVLVVHEALNKLFEMTGECRLTIGSLCLNEFNRLAFGDRAEQKAFFPDLSKVFCPVAGFKNTDEYIRKAYHGGWCLVKSGMENKIIKGGCTADVNSLYPSMMHGESGNSYPWGLPHYFTGDVPDEIKAGSKEGRYYYYIRVRCRFVLKPDHLPTIQIKGNPLYPARKWLETSDINGVNVYRDFDGKIKKCIVTMTLSQTDFDLIKDHYFLYDLEYLDGCYFYAVTGIFDDYINKWAEIKQHNKGAVRTLAKLFLNNLYGKLAASTDSSYKIPFLEDGVLKNKIVVEHNKDAGYIAAGAAVTSYARNFTIRHAQENYENFIYADTDSIHCKCRPEDLINIREHETAFQCWKIENEWDNAVFVRAKTYIEHNVKQDGEPCTPHYMVKCAGLGKQAKNVLVDRLENGTMSLKDFRVGLIVPHNLKAKQIKGGTVLIDNEYVMR